METHPANRRLLGLLFIVVGAILLMRFLDILPFNIPYYFFSWKTILMALGIVFILSEKSKSTGVILFTIGAVFLARDILRIDFATLLQLAIPILLLVIGLVILMPRRRSRQIRHHGVTFQEVKGAMSEVNIFSGGTKYINSEDFNGGEITCIFGGAELNFKNSLLAPGNNVLDVTCIFGGCTLYVPEDWTVHIETTNIFAGFTDNRLKANLNLATDPNKVLYVKGVLIFGGGEIKFA